MPSAEGGLTCPSIKAGHSSGQAPSMSMGFSCVCLCGVPVSTVCFWQHMDVPVCVVCLCVVCGMYHCGL